MIKSFSLLREIIGAVIGFESATGRESRPGSSRLPVAPFDGRGRRRSLSR